MNSPFFHIPEVDLGSDDLLLYLQDPIVEHLILHKPQEGFIKVDIITKEKKDVSS